MSMNNVTLFKITANTKI